MTREFKRRRPRPPERVAGRSRAPRQWQRRGRPEPADLQRQLGNRGTRDWLDLQTQPVVGTPGDRYEREADAAAERIIRGEAPPPVSQRQENPESAVIQLERATESSPFALSLDIFDPFPANRPELIESAMGSAVLDNFAVDSAGITSAHEASLDELAEYLRGVMYFRETSVLWVTGYTDEPGSDEHNYRLGLQRAEAVREALIRRNIAADRIFVRSEGEGRPVGRARGYDPRNRRVEIEYEQPQSTLVLSGTESTSEEAEQVVEVPPGVRPDIPESPEAVITSMLTRLSQEIREDDHLRGFFNLPEHPGEERRGPRLRQTVREGLVAYLTDRLAPLGPLAGLLAEGVIDGLPALAEAAVDQFTRFEDGLLRNALSRVAEGVVQRILGTRLRPEEAAGEESQLPPPRRVEGVGQPFRMRGIEIPVRIGRRAYERQRRRQQLMREEERERLREEERRRNE